MMHWNLVTKPKTIEQAHLQQRFGEWAVILAVLVVLVGAVSYGAARVSCFVVAAVVFAGGVMMRQEARKFLRSE